MAIKILVVDQMEKIADSLAAIFRLHGYETKVFYSDQAALSAVECWIPDIAVMDLISCEVHGVNVARFLEGRYPQVRILLMTSHCRSPLIEEATGEGWEVMDKPIPPEMLLGRVANLLAGSEFRATS